MTPDAIVGAMIDNGETKEAIMAYVRTILPKSQVRRLQNQRAYQKRKLLKPAETCLIQQVLKPAENLLKPAEFSMSSRGDNNLLNLNLTEFKKEKKDIFCAFEAEFHEIFWPAYPRKKGKKEALKAFIKARKKHSLEAIMAGVKAYCSEVAGKEEEFVKFPQGWLNGARFEDITSQASSTIFVAEDAPTYRMLKVRWQNIHELQSPSVIEHGGMTGSEFPAEWITDAKEYNDDWEGIRGESDQVYSSNSTKGHVAEGQRKNTRSDPQEVRTPRAMGRVVELLQAEWPALFCRIDDDEEREDRTLPVTH